MWCLVVCRGGDGVVGGAAITGVDDGDVDVVVVVVVARDAQMDGLNFFVGCCMCWLAWGTFAY